MCDNWKNFLEIITRFLETISRNKVFEGDLRAKSFESSTFDSSRLNFCDKETDRVGLQLVESANSLLTTGVKFSEESCEDWCGGKKGGPQLKVLNSNFACLP